MKNQFVPYHIAIDLKELVFDEKCMGVYHRMDENFYMVRELNEGNPEYKIFAPLWQQVEQWFREKHGILISVDAVKYRRGNLEWGYFISIRNGGGYIITGCEHKGIEDPYKIPYYHSYEEAREAAVLEAIELLKEKNYEQI